MNGYKLVSIKLDDAGNKVSCVIEKDKIQHEYTTSSVVEQLLLGLKIKNAVVINNELCFISSNGHFEDLSGQYINEWYVIDYLGNKYWRCQCSCGKIKAVHAGSLLNNRTQNCGAHNRLEKRELTGQTIGDWHVDSYAGNKKWNCTCINCNKHEVISTDSLYYCRNTKCKCNDSRHSYNFQDLTGMTFENWTVLSLAEATTKGTYWNCICKCSPDKIHKVHAYGLVSGRSTSCGCLSSFSKEEQAIADFIASKGFAVERNTRKIIAPKELDIYVPEKRFAIEYNGIYWHKNKPSTYHLDKTEQCNKNKITLLHIFDYEWRDINKRNIIIDIIDKNLGTNKTVIYARNTELRPVQLSEAKQFLELYHLQGWFPAEVYLGLYYNNELVELMTFGTSRFNTQYDYELLRLCSKLGVTVVGGAGKLFSAFIETHKNKSIISYCNRSKFNGKVYEQLGMKLLGSTEPSYIYTNGSYNNILSRYSCTKQKLLEKGWGTAEMTEEQIMTEHGYSRVYDCGTLKYAYLPN